MKKILPILIVLALLCSVTAATAEELEIQQGEDLFSIGVTLPEGAHVANFTSDDQFSMLEIGFDTEGRPSIVITVAADELYIGQSLSDLTQDEKNLIISEITVEMVSPQVEIRTSQAGYEYIVANETTEANDTSDTMMLLDGYFVMVHVYNEDYSELNPEDAEIGPSIVETLHYLDGGNS